MSKLLCVLMIKLFLFILYLDFPGQVRVNQSDYPSLSLNHTRVIPLYSTIMKDEYLLNILFPRDYNSDTTKHYPVVYVLDGWALSSGYYFVYHMLNIEEEIPDLITVGISHKGNYQKWVEKRKINMTPKKSTLIDYNRMFSPENKLLRGEDFMEFIIDELIPFIDSNLRTDKTDRTLIGVSLGAYFGLYIMFEKPDIFNRYILGGPVFKREFVDIFDLEEAFYRQRKTINAKIFISEGLLELDKIEGINRFAEILRRREYKGLTLETAAFEGETHFTSIPLTLLKGLQYAFRKDSE